ncbi:hypothetical protein BDZ94DRAFT_332657 [Collybia nuda]|uniref:Uncharacterized protein n=1 Tax=Collybia nuda TaxID=64659 RepID=A0A9P5XTN4_9AGAR|nr:hypothetical protein BDZ94DRAFT_332657 [Collybia nuda]
MYTNSLYSTEAYGVLLHTSNTREECGRQDPIFKIIDRDWPCFAVIFRANSGPSQQRWVRLGPSSETHGDHYVFLFLLVYAFVTHMAFSHLPNRPIGYLRTGSFWYPQAEVLFGRTFITREKTGSVPRGAKYMIHDLARYRAPLDTFILTGLGAAVPVRRHFCFTSQKRSSTQ